MIPIDVLAERYSKLGIHRSKFRFRRIYTEEAMEFAKRKGYDTPLGLVTSESHSELRNELRESLRSAIEEKEFPVGLFSSDEILQSFLTESAIALERSLYWYFNHRLNLQFHFEVSSRQSLYYSELNAIISLSRFLGRALTRVLPSSLGLHIQTTVNWKVRPPTINLHWRRGGRHHLDHYQLLKDSIDEFSFVLDRCKLAISGLEEPLLKENREDAVYELYHDIFQSIREGPSLQRTDFSFLGTISVQELEDKIRGHQGDERDDILDAYSEWGYRESHIGALLRDVISGFWEVGGKMVEFLDLLRYNIESISHMPDECKKDILDWLTRKPRALK